MKALKFIINREEQEIPSHKWVNFLNWIQWSVDITWSDWISIDEDNNTIKISWREYTPWPLIDIKSLFNYYEYLKWPCAEWFHVPSAYTWDRIRNFGITLWAWSSWSYDNIKTYLKLPFWWYVSNLWSSWDSWNAYYWLANTNSTSSSKALKITSSSYSTSTWYGRAYGMFIRPEKDEKVIPDASWTTVYDGSSIASGAWIFHNSTLWLISISEDGSNWITIADKNVWATVVYNNWDTLDSTNCWSFFQWGNCYPFPYSLNMEKSSTRVDASGYWPTNLYYGRVFICWSGISDWSSVSNWDLWWWYSFDDRLSKFNVIICKWIFSINGKTWPSVHLNSNAIVSSEAPNDIETWLLWYDTTNDVLKSYNWTTWVEVWWWIKNNTTWTTYTLQEEWVWEESQFNQLSNFWNIIYNVIE